MFYITSTKIYQGKLTKNSYGLVFKENDVIDDEMYKQILAS